MEKMTDSSIILPEQQPCLQIHSPEALLVLDNDESRQQENELFPPDFCCEYLERKIS